MKRSPLFGIAAACTAILPLALRSEIILEYGTAGSTTSLAPLTSNIVVTADNLDAGSGIDVQSFSTYNFSNWDPANTSYADAVADDEVWTWGFTVTTADRQIDLTTMNIRLDRSTTGPDDFEIRASVNGGGAVTLLTYDYLDADVGVDFLDVDISAIGTVSTGDSVVFTLAAFNSEGTGGTFDLELVPGETYGIQVNGTVSIGSGPDTFPPVILSLSPVDDAFEVALNTNLSVTFNEPIQAGSGSITLHLGLNNAIVESIPVGSANVSIVGNSLTINPSADLLEATTYYVQLPAGVVEDLTGNPFGGLTGSTAWNFASDSGSLPPDIAYYSPVIGLTGNTLKVQLEQIIDNHTVIPYTSGNTDVWDAHADLFEDPNNANNLIMFYSQASVAKSFQDDGSSPDSWNREHLWPRSYGVGQDGPDFSDLFHLTPAYRGVNSSRGNLYFDYSNPLDASYDDPAYYLSPNCTSDSNSWEPADGQKGWTARALFYMTTRYNYLTLVDTSVSPEPFVDGTFMAQLPTLLEWNRRFLPVLKEQEFNQAIFDNYQGNRNPYIDFPEFADAVFVDGPSWGGWRLAHFSFAELVDPAISGDLADPDFDGISNLVEMARYSDPRVADTPAIESVSSGSQVAVSFLRASDLSNLNLVMEVQVSTDMVTWDPLPLGAASVTVINPEQEEVTVLRSVAAGEAEFYRIKVIRP